MNNFAYHNPVKVVFGLGTLKQAGDEAAKLGVRALVVSYGDASVAGTLAKLKGLLDAAKAFGADLVVGVVEAAGGGPRRRVRGRRGRGRVGRLLDPRFDLACRRGGRARPRGRRRLRSPLRPLAVAHRQVGGMGTDVTAFQEEDR